MARWQVWTATTALATMVTAGTAFAQSSDLYVGLSGGTATYFDQNNLEYDYFGYVVAGQMGMRLSPELRVEGELAYESTSAEIDNTNIDVDVSVLRPSVSAYYDLTAMSLGGMTPFAGAGLGISFLDVDGGGDDEELSAHLDGGLNMALGSGLDLVPLARWELTDDASNFQLRVGARVGF